MLFESNAKINGIDFFPINKLTKKEFDRYYDTMAIDIKMLWQMNYTYIMTSENSQKHHLYKVIDDMLCIFQKYTKGMALLFIPIGKCDSKKMNTVLDKCFDIMKKCSNADYSTRVDWVNEKQIELLDSAIFKFSKMVDKKTVCKDYIYDPYMVSSMSGGDYQYMRRKINKFNRTYPDAIIREYEEKDYPQMKILAKEWKEYVKNEVERYFFLVDANYYENTIKDHKKLNHKIFVVELNKRIIGMVTGGWIIDEEYAWCFNRKPLNQYEGLSELLVWKICDEFKDAQYLNDGSGSAGLSFFKERFRPVIINELYTVTHKK